MVNININHRRMIDSLKMFEEKNLQHKMCL